MNKGRISKITHFLGSKKDYTLVGISIIVVLLATLYPFDFSWPQNFGLQEFVASFDNLSSFQDRVNNILLFIPLGFFAASILQRLRTKLIFEISIIILISAGLSTTVEVLQVFLSTRTPTPADIVNNSIGGFCGWLCFNWVSSRKFARSLARIEHNTSSQIIKRTVVFSFGYILLTILTLMLWQSTTHLSNWSPNFPLAIGNEATGNRPWQGYVSDIKIADQAISASQVSQVFDDKKYFHKLGDSLIASYDLDTSRELFYLDQSGNLPKLLWRGQSSEIEESKGVSLSSSNWLKTEAPVKSLSKRISKTSEFTISTTVATNDINQAGPARIISISNDGLRRNFTLGQQNTTLSLRLRTPITGQNAVDIVQNIPEVFTDNEPHHIIITYSRATIRVYIDNSQNFYSLNLFDLMPREQKIFYYLLTFMPLGMYLALLTFMAKKKQMIHRVLIFLGILLPSLMLEVILVSENGKEISLRNILLGVFFTASTVLILRIRAAMLVKNIA